MKTYKLKVLTGVMIAGKAYKKDDEFFGALSPHEYNVLINRKLAVDITNQAEGKKK